MIAPQTINATPSTALAAHRDQVRDILRGFGLENPRLFGSASRGADREDSDLDLLVDAPPGTSLYDLAGAEQALEALLGCKVEVLTPGFLAPDVAARVQADLVPIP
jgi:predicted nucleotidyltransferase